MGTANIALLLKAPHTCTVSSRMRFTSKNAVHCENLHAIILCVRVHIVGLAILLADCKCFLFPQHYTQIDAVHPHKHGCVCEIQPLDAEHSKHSIPGQMSYCGYSTLSIPGQLAFHVILTDASNKPT